MTTMYHAEYPTNTPPSDVLATCPVCGMVFAMEEHKEFDPLKPTVKCPECETVYVRQEYGEWIGPVSLLAQDGFILDDESIT